MKQSNRELLIQKKQYYTQMAEICDDILQGESVVDACRQHSVSLPSFRNRIFKKESNYLNLVSTEDLADSLEDFLLPEERLLNDILGDVLLKYRHHTAVIFPIDFVETLNCVIEELPDDRMKEILHDVYWNNKTFTEIGKEYDITSSRVGQIVQKSLISMRRNDTLMRLIYGDKEYQNLIERIDDNDFIHQLLKEVSWAIYRGEDPNRICNTLLKRVSLLQEIFNEKRSILPNTSIEALALSVRSYNSLMRYKRPWTIDELDKKTDEELLRIPNLGKKCLQEIRQKIAEYKKSIKRIHTAENPQ